MSQGRAHLMGQVGGLRRVAGRYRLIEVLGRGGMGTVWRAEDELLGRAVAVKVIAAPQATLGSGAPDEPQPETSAQTAGRARREARAAGRLNHSGAVTVHDIIEEDGRFHIIMELIQAPTLSELVRAEGPLSPARVAAIGAQLLDVLDFAHAEGIVHRDVKPSNVMVLPGDRVKLTDFGIAALRGDPQLTTSGATLGSPLFMAPEQAAGTVVGPPADLWSLGATMYFAVEGRVPFDREVAMAALAAILSQPPDPLLLAGPLEPALTALLVRAPQSRPDSAALRDLLSLAALGSSTAVAPATDSGPAAGAPTLSTADPEATLDLDATLGAPDPATPVPAKPAAANPDPAHPEPAEPVASKPAASATATPASSDPSATGPGLPSYGTPSYGSPEGADPASAATRPDQPVVQDRSTARPTPVARRPDGKVLKGLVGVLTVAVAGLSFALLQADQESTKPVESSGTTAQQNPGLAKDANPAGETGAAVAADGLAPSAATAPSDGLGLGSAGRPGLRTIEPDDVGPVGQNLAKNFDSATNPVGGYAIGVPLTFEVVTAGPTTFIEQHSPMFQAGFEVRSYQSVDPWARLVQDEKQFAKDHADDRYERKELTRQWTYRGQRAVSWEFTWMLKGELMHAQEVAFQVGSRTYTVLYHSVDLWWLGGGSASWPDGFERSFYPLR